MKTPRTPAPSKRNASLPNMNTDAAEKFPDDWARLGLGERIWIARAEEAGIAAGVDQESGNHLGWYLVGEPEAFERTGLFPHQSWACKSRFTTTTLDHAAKVSFLPTPEDETTRICIVRFLPSCAAAALYDSGKKDKPFRTFLAAAVAPVPGLSPLDEVDEGWAGRVPVHLMFSIKQDYKRRGVFSMLTGQLGKLSFKVSEGLAASLARDASEQAEGGGGSMPKRYAKMAAQLHEQLTATHGGAK